MTTKLFIMFLCISCVVQAQRFKQGTLLTHDGKTVTGYIEDVDQTRPVLRVAYRMSKNGGTQHFKASDVQEILFKRERIIIATVQIDNRSNELGQLRFQDRTPDFHFEERTLALKVIVYGEAMLYRSYLETVEKFFFSTPKQPLTQLLYKKFFMPRPAFYVGSDAAHHNREYYQQLFEYVRCVSKKGIVDYPDYDRPSLRKYFEKYNNNEC